MVPDVEEIAFQSFRDDNQEIYVIPASGGSARRLTNHLAEDSVPTWFDNGTRIAFVSRRLGSRDLWTVDADGGEPDGNIWAVSIEDGREFPVTDLRGKDGRVGWGKATDGEYIYFTRWEDRGDI